ncbi:hypothetical protein Tco_1071169 [Tanacetum coccineum]|uniref:Uncharacterized protein n=1 Tax=Tanacetum coccineum TaxID=301880 RepID=A0ABQ5HQ29_9ASTR
MEVDLSAGTQLVYTFPDMILSVNDFHNHVEVAIQTHGYDTWQGGESNLLITMALTGRLSNTSYMGFQYSVENWDAITSNQSEDDAINDDGKYHYNRKGFLEDDESSDDSILIVDPGWDDYCLQELKLNRPVLLFPEARRDRM